MNKDDKKKIEKELNKKYYKLIDNIKENETKARLLENNNIQTKLPNILIFSLLPYVILFMATFMITESIGIKNFTNLISPKYIPIITIGTSLSLGILTDKIINMTTNLKTRLKEFSNAKSSVEILENQIMYEIEKEKNINKSLVLQDSLLTLNTNIPLLFEDEIILDENKLDLMKKLSEKKLFGLEKKINEKYQELDSISTKKVLNQSFGIIQENKILENIVHSTLGGVLSIVFSNLPFIHLNGTIQLSTEMFLIPGFIGTLLTASYLIKKDKDNKIVFDKFNNQLKEIIPPEKLKDIHEEYREITKDLNKTIKETSLVLLLIEKEKRHLETITNLEKQKVLVNKKVLEKVSNIPLENSILELPIEENSKVYKKTLF